MREGDAKDSREDEPDGSNGGGTRTSLMEVGARHQGGDRDGMGADPEHEIEMEMPLVRAR